MKSFIFALIPILVFSTSVLARTASQVFEKVSDSIVVVLAQDSQGEFAGLGSGVVLQDGSIATNCHVIENARKVAVRYQQEQYPAEKQYTDWERDICTVKASGLEAQPVTVGSTQGLTVGSRIYAIGAPRGLELTLSEGIISSIRPVRGGQYLQITAPISPGSSGGGLFDSQGRLLGLTSFYVDDGQNLNFALPVEWITELSKRHVERTSVVPDTTDYNRWAARSFSLIFSGDWEEAIRHNSKWTQAMPNSPEAWSNLADAYERLYFFSRAIDAYKEFVRIQPNNAQAWYRLGMAYKKDRRSSGRSWNSSLQNGINAFQESLNLDSQNSNAWCALGLLYLDYGDGYLEYHRKSRDALRRALKLTPRNVCALSGFGQYYFAMYSILVDLGEQEKRKMRNHAELGLSPLTREQFGIDPGDMSGVGLGRAWYRYSGPLEYFEFRNELGFEPPMTMAKFRKRMNIEENETKYDFLDKAFEYYQKVLEKDQDFADALSGIGSCYLEYSKLNNANKDAMQNNALQYFLRAADAYDSLGYRAPRVNAYKAIVEIEPQEKKGWINLGLTSKELAKYTRSTHALKSSIDAFEQALGIDPNNVEVWIELGSNYNKTWARWDDYEERVQQGIDAYRQALSLEPQNSQAWSGLGKIYDGAGQLEKAIDAYRQASKHNPENALIWYELGRLYGSSRIGQLNKAIEVLQRSLKLDPDSSRAWGILGTTYQDSGKYTEAIEAYQQALRINPRKILTWRFLGDAYADVNQWTKAIEAYQHALHIYPEDTLTLNALGVAYRMSGQLSKSIETHKQTIKIRPGVREWYNLGLAYKAKGNTSKVMEIYERLQHLNPSVANDFFREVVLP